MTVLGSEPRDLIAPMSKPTPEEQAKIDKYTIEQESAVKIYNRKLIEFPELVLPPEPVVKKKKKRGFMGGTNMSQMEHIEQEKITDDQGREIQFKKPNGDALSSKKPFFVTAKGKEVST